jgi:hypothetical protein
MEALVELVVQSGLSQIAMQTMSYTARRILRRAATHLLREGAQRFFVTLSAHEPVQAHHDVFHRTDPIRAGYL